MLCNVDATPEHRDDVKPRMSWFSERHALAFWAASRLLGGLLRGALLSTMVWPHLGQSLGKLRQKGVTSS